MEHLPSERGWGHKPSIKQPRDHLLKTVALISYLICSAVREIKTLYFNVHSLVKCRKDLWDYSLFKVDVFDHSGIGIVHPDAPNVSGSKSKIHQSLLMTDAITQTIF